MMDLLDGTIVAVGADTPVDRFDVGLTPVGWVSTACLSAVTVAIPLTAWAGERFAATVLVMSAMGACVFSTLFTLPPHHQVLGGQAVPRCTSSTNWGPRRGSQRCRCRRRGGACTARSGGSWRCTW